MIMMIGVKSLSSKFLMQTTGSVLVNVNHDGIGLAKVVFSPEMTVGNAAFDNWFVMAHFFITSTSNVPTRQIRYSSPKCQMITCIRIRIYLKPFRSKRTFHLYIQTKKTATRAVCVLRNIRRGYVGFAYDAGSDNHSRNRPSRHAVLHKSWKFPK